jgi:hypothetical protein
VSGDGAQMTGIVWIRCAGPPVVTHAREAPTEYDQEPPCGWEAADPFGCIADGRPLPPCPDCGAPTEIADPDPGGVTPPASSGAADPKQHAIDLGAGALARLDPAPGKAMPWSLAARIVVEAVWDAFANPAPYLAEIRELERRLAQGDHNWERAQQQLDEYEYLREAIVSSPYVTLNPATRPAKVAEEILSSLANWQAAASAALDTATELQAEVERLRQERDLAITHDRQPYPTADAYEQACKALERFRQALADLLDADSNHAEHGAAVGRARQLLGREP